MKVMDIELIGSINSTQHASMGNNKRRRVNFEEVTKERHSFDVLGTYY